MRKFLGHACFLVLLLLGVWTGLAWHVLWMVLFGLLAILALATFLLGRVPFTRPSRPPWPGHPEAQDDEATFPIRPPGRWYALLLCLILGIMGVTLMVRGDVKQSTTPLGIAIGLLAYSQGTTGVAFRLSSDALIRLHPRRTQHIALHDLLLVRHRNDLLLASRSGIPVFGRLRYRLPRRLVQRRVLLQMLEDRIGAAEA